MSNDAELRTQTFNGASRAYAERAMQRVLAWIEWAEDGDDATNPGMCADDVKTALAFAASERSHDGEWEAMRERCARLVEQHDWARSPHTKVIDGVSPTRLALRSAGAAIRALGSAVSLSDDVGDKQ